MSGIIIWTCFVLYVASTFTLTTYHVANIGGNHVVSDTRVCETNKDAFQCSRLQWRVRASASVLLVVSHFSLFQCMNLTQFQLAQRTWYIIVSHHECKLTDTRSGLCGFQGKVPSALKEYRILIPLSVVYEFGLFLVASYKAYVFARDGVASQFLTNFYKDDCLCFFVSRLPIILSLVAIIPNFIPAVRHRQLIYKYDNLDF